VGGKQAISLGVYAQEIELPLRCRNLDGCGGLKGHGLIRCRKSADRAREHRGYNEAVCNFHSDFTTSVEVMDRQKGDLFEVGIRLRILQKDT
jgi:hypothetical protein